VNIVRSSEDDYYNKSKIKTGYTPLHLACMNKHFDMIKLLIKNGTDVNKFGGPEESTDCYLCGNHTPFHLAIPDIQIMEYLIDHNADINANGGNTPLLYAIVSGNLNAVKLLVDNNADFKRQDARGQTPLHEAALWGYTNIVTYLIAEGADVNATTPDGYTP